MLTVEVREEKTMSGAKHRQKGNRIEREIVKLHGEIGIHAERVPLSGAVNYKDTAGHDVDVYLLGVEECPVVFEVKSRKSGDGFRLLERWLENAEGLFLRSDRNKPLVVLPWETYLRLVEELKKCDVQRARKERPLAAILEKPVAGEGGSNG
jgi:Holliday junction resolvase